MSVLRCRENVYGGRICPCCGVEKMCIVGGLCPYCDVRKMCFCGGGLCPCCGVGKMCFCGGWLCPYCGVRKMCFCGGGLCPCCGVGTMCFWIGKKMFLGWWVMSVLWCRESVFFVVGYVCVTVLGTCVSGVVLHSVGKGFLFG